MSRSVYEMAKKYYDKNGKEISQKEYRRRKRLSKKIKDDFEKRRVKGFNRYIRKLRKDIAKRKEKERKKKEREREKRRLEREKAKKKRRVGRPRKTGPKINFYKRRKKALAKLNKVRKSTKLPPFTYKIIICRNGVKKKLVGKYRSSEAAFEALNKLKKENENIIFPVDVTGADILENSIDEYLLLEESDGENLFMRNEYGKLIEQKVNIDGWRILDKYRFKKEEDFWIYGYDNRKERKSFQWIYDNLLTQGIDNIYIFNRILVFRNKVIVKYDNGSMDIIFCKNPYDAVRFYNLAETWAKRDKNKQLLFIGDYSERSEKRRKLENEIMELTGWSRKKVNMNGTTYYMVNKKEKNNKNEEND